MHLICVRHGRTAWNAERRFQGHSDIPLDDEGRAQARGLAALLREDPIDVAVSSDLSRAVETARIVLGDRAVRLRLDPAWREMQLGDWEGLTWEQILAANPDLVDMKEMTPRTYAARGGESFDDLCVRIAGAVAGVQAQTPPNGTALVATHAGVLHALLRVLLGEAESKALSVRFVPASLTRFTFEGARWQLDVLNETAVAS
ncbi:MAG: histidine phosphatase family protein [Vulcanimicrobiaceae bacterium]